MPFIMTQAGETADVEIEIDGEKLILTVGTIPNEIGEKIQQFGMGNLEAVKAQQAGDEDKMIEVLSQNVGEVNQMVMLVLKYGIRNIRGLEYADGSAVPCETEEEAKTGYTILSKKTLDLYLSSNQLLTPVSGVISKLRTIGIGKYNKGKFTTIEEAFPETDKKKDKKEVKEASQKVPLKSCSAL